MSSISQSLRFAGYDLKAICDVVEVSRDLLPQIAHDAATVPGRDGAAFLRARLEPRDIEAVLRTVAGGIAPADFEAAFRALAAKLPWDGPKKLEIENGYHYMAALVGTSDVRKNSYSAEATLTFRAYDPAAYGAAASKALSTTSSSATVGGTYPTRPKVTSSNAVRNSSGVWGVTMGGCTMKVALPTASASSVVIDCDARTVKVNGAAAMLTLDSDWCELQPGSRSMRVSQGTGAATAEWTERWL